MTEEKLVLSCAAIEQPQSLHCNQERIERLTFYGKAILVVRETC
jgi:hypothetical protein